MGVWDFWIINSSTLTNIPPQHGSGIPCESHATIYPARPMQLSLFSCVSRKCDVFSRFVSNGSEAYYWNWNTLPFPQILRSFLGWFASGFATLLGVSAGRFQFRTVPASRKPPCQPLHCEAPIHRHECMGSASQMFLSPRVRRKKWRSI